jgi:hypothetical protein
MGGAIQPGWLWAEIDPRNHQIITISGGLSDDWHRIDGSIDMELNFLDVLPPQKVGMESGDTAFEVAEKIKGIFEEELFKSKGFTATVDSDPSNPGYASVIIERTVQPGTQQPATGYTEPQQTSAAPEQQIEEPAVYPMDESMPVDEVPSGESYEICLEAPC